MAKEQSQLRVTDLDGVTRFEFVDRDILDEASIRAIGEEMLGRIEATAKPRVVITFQNVEHLSSAALGTLITVSSAVKKKGGQLCLSDIKPSILEVFRITKLNRVFTIHPTAAEAVKSLA